MLMPDTMAMRKAAIFAVAEIKAATDAFDRGDRNVFDTLDAIVAAIEAWQAATRPRREVA
ncbi:MAG: hypothetical protein ACKO4T_06700 [Planctomycetaceae bacterium]